MTRWTVLAVLAAFVSICAMPTGAARAESAADDDFRLSEPAIHGNLAIYFVHGKSRPGPVPLTLQEALAGRSVEMRETGDVNRLEVENVGDRDVFIQAGDIVKGGKQDRVLGVSLVLPPRSGPLSIAAYCVEQGRWSPRDGEDAKTFASADAVLPSRASKLELAGADPMRSATHVRQRAIWKDVARIQGRLSSNLGAAVAAPRSTSSLQLALENARLDRARADYLEALQPLGEKDDDIVGYAFAINGRINSADLYPSNALFRKMWPKLLRGSITEAIGERDAPAAPPPAVPAVSTFLVDANRGRPAAKPLDDRGVAEVRQSAAAVLSVARPAAAPASAWMHRNYLAK
jgi:hypothetical protein